MKQSALPLSDPFKFENVYKFKIKQSAFPYIENCWVYSSSSCKCFLLNKGQSDVTPFTNFGWQNMNTSISIIRQ